MRIEILSIIFDELDLQDDETVRAMAHAYGSIRQQTGVLLYPGIELLLRDLKADYKLGLLTNGPSDISWEKIVTLGFDHTFDAIVVAGDIEIYKPDGRVFETLLQKLNLPANQVLFVGDNYTADIVGAHRAGMFTAWIRRTEDDTWDTVEPTVVTSDTAALREVLL